MQSETQEEVSEKVMEGLQPHTLKVGMCQGPSLLIEGAGFMSVKHAKYTPMGIALCRSRQPRTW